MNFPPVKKAVPEGYWCNGVKQSSVNSAWGKVSVKVQRLRGRAGKQRQMYWDASLDESGWTPNVLGQLLAVAARVPYEEASDVLALFGVNISRSKLCELTSCYAQHCHTQVSTYLTSCQEQALASKQTNCEHVQASPTTQASPTAQASPQARTWVLQLDGVYVLGQPQQGHCPGLEIKSAVLYAQDCPQQRWMMATRTTPDDLLPCLAGLLQQAPIAPHDRLVGLGDGAPWIANLFAHFCLTHITDVFHACDYLDTIMQALAWSDVHRLQQRRRWYRAEVNARDWLAQHLPSPDIWATWPDDALTALRYLDARLDTMDYAHFAKQGLPIGSGQVEAMNKAVIGHRLKRSGMHWSATNAAAVAALRAQVCASHPLIDMQSLRYLAFPPPELSP